MRIITKTGAALLLSTSVAQAVGLDRSGQPVGIIFEEGDYAELNYGYVRPTIDGSSTTTATTPISNVANDYGVLGFGLKTDINEQVSFSLIVDEPYGADIEYPASTAAPLTNTTAKLESLAFTGLARYEFDENFSVHAGIRVQQVSGNVVLPGAGTTVQLDQSTGTGYLVGGAYERPENGLRVALTYFSEVDHDFTTTTGGAFTETLNVTTPQAVNLDFQTGVAQDTLLFGSVRWAEYSVVNVTPTPVGLSIVNVEDGFTYSLGVGHRFSEKFAASITASRDTPGEDDLVSPLAPVNGNYSIGINGQYKVNDRVTVSGGIRYIVFGDVRPAINVPVADTPYANLSDNSAVAVGFKVGYHF